MSDRAGEPGSDLYRDRPLSDGYPDLERLVVEYFTDHQQSASTIDVVFDCVARLIDLDHGPKTAVVVGCGPNPGSVKKLLELGWDAKGIEPIPAFVGSAGAFLGDPERVLPGVAERLPLPDGSQRVVVMQSVLEHVDSVNASLTEAFRVLEPGGVLYVSTTNRHALTNGEFRSRFYQWFPPVVKESFVFHHLHFDPKLANYSPRPAVHWFCYADLCRLGREVGFAQFYSPIDLADPASEVARKNLSRRLFLRAAQRHPYARALALTFRGDAIFMLKRPDAAA